MARQFKSNQEKTGTSSRRRGSRSQREKRRLILSFVLLAVALIAIYWAWQRNYQALEQQNVLRTLSVTERKETTASTRQDILGDAVTLGEINISGLTQAEAFAAVEKFLERFLERELTLVEARLAGDGGFTGIAVHDAAGWAALPP